MEQIKEYSFIEMENKIYFKLTVMQILQMKQHSTTT